MRCVFDDYLLDTQRYEFLHQSRSVKLRPKVFQVLSYLIEYRDRVVSKDELLEQLWSDQFIGDGSLTACLMAVRKAVGDGGQEQRYIQTLHGRGYRFIAEVDVDIEAEATLSRVAPTLMSAPLGDQMRSCITRQHNNPAHAAYCMACGVALRARCSSGAERVSNANVSCPTAPRRVTSNFRPMRSPFNKLTRDGYRGETIVPVQYCADRCPVARLGIAALIPHAHASLQSWYSRLWPSRLGSFE